MSATTITSPLEERVILLNANAEPTGETAPKRTVHTAHTPYHAAFSVFVIDSTGTRTLLQQRALSKHTWPGVWSNACCGHVRVGETVYSAATRRAQEELGVQLVNLRKLADFSYFVERDNIVEYEFCPILIASINSTPERNPEEVENTAWMPLADYLSIARALPIIPGQHPQTRASFTAYREAFPSLAEYTRAHALPNGEPLSEWSLWELLVISNGTPSLLSQYLRERSAS